MFPKNLGPPPTRKASDMEGDEFFQQWKRLRARFDIPGRTMYLPTGELTEEEADHLNEFWRIFKNEPAHVWERVCDNCIENWLPPYGVPFPLPGHLKSIMSGIETRQDIGPHDLDPFERWCRQMDDKLRRIPKDKWRAFVDAAVAWGRNHDDWGPLAKGRWWFKIDIVGHPVEQTKKGTEADMQEIRKRDESFWRCVFRYYYAEKNGITVPRRVA